MSNLYVYIDEMVNNAANIIICKDSVVYADSLTEAQEFFLSIYDFQIEYWEEDYGNGVKFSSLTGQEKINAINQIFNGGEIFEIKTSEIKKIN